MSLLAARGVARLARFRADGLAAFDASPAGLLNALTPWFAFSLVGCALMLVSGWDRQALGDLLGSVAWLLTPPVLSHALAQLWGREAAWLRYAVATTWCLWLMPLVLLVALMSSVVMVAAGVPDNFADRAAMLAASLYTVALHGFVIRRGLGLSIWRTAGLLLAVDLGTLAAAVGPTLLAAVLDMGALASGPT